MPNYSPIPQALAPAMAPQQPKQTGTKWLPLVLAIVGGAFVLVALIAAIMAPPSTSTQGPSQAEREQAFTSSVRANWPTNAQPYTDAQLVKAGNRVCLFDDWDVEVHGSRADVNKMFEKMRDIDHINDSTLRHGIFSVARGNGGLCS